MWNRLSLRLKLTLLTGGVLFLITVGITAISVISAGSFFWKPVALMATRAVSPQSLTSSEAISEDSVSQDEIYQQYVDSNNGFRQLSFAVMIVMTAAGTFLTWIVAGQALKPVTRLSQDMEAIDETNLSVKLPVSPSNDEITKLTLSFNRLMERLRMAYESQKRFSQNAAHELKTPVASILTNIEVLEMGEDSDSIDEYKETVSVIKQETERMSTLISDMLALSGYKHQGNAEQISMNSLLAHLLHQHEEAIKENGLTVQLDGDWEIVGNRFLLERAFSNIIQNAIRYNTQNGTIDIECRPGTVTIRDSGIGIPEDKLQHVCEPFFCIDESRSKALGGNGLGLSITKEIFDRFAIEMTIASEEQVGTTVQVIWPADLSLP